MMSVHKVMPVKEMIELEKTAMQNVKSLVLVGGESRPLQLSIARRLPHLGNDDLIYSSRREVLSEALRNNDIPKSKPSPCTSNYEVCRSHFYQTGKHNNTKLTTTEPLNMSYMNSCEGNRSNENFLSVDISQDSIPTHRSYSSASPNSVAISTF